MVGVGLVRGLKVGDRTGEFQNPRLGPCGETEFLHGGLDERLGIGMEGAVFLDMSRLHLAVVINLVVLKPLELEIPP